MATRAMIILKGWDHEGPDDHALVYRHNDGDPDWTVPDLIAARDRFRAPTANCFGEPQTFSWDHFGGRSDYMAAAVIAVTAGGFIPADCLAADAEFLYVVTPKQVLKRGIDWELEVWTVGDGDNYGLTNLADTCGLLHKRKPIGRYAEKYPFRGEQFLISDVVRHEVRAYKGKVGDRDLTTNYGGFIDREQAVKAGKWRAEASKCLVEVREITRSAGERIIRTFPAPEPVVV